MVFFCHLCFSSNSNRNNRYFSPIYWWKHFRVYLTYQTAMAASFPDSRLSLHISLKKYWHLTINSWRKKGDKYRQACSSSLVDCLKLKNAPRLLKGKQNYKNILKASIDRKNKPWKKNRLGVLISEGFKCAVPLQPKPVYVQAFPFLTFWQIWHMPFLSTNLSEH